jgi:hypothetical protein
MANFSWALGDLFADSLTASLYSLMADVGYGFLVASKYAGDFAFATGVFSEVVRYGLGLGSQAFHVDSDAECAGCDAPNATGCDVQNGKGCDAPNATGCDAQNGKGCDVQNGKGCDAPNERLNLWFLGLFEAELWSIAFLSRNVHLAFFDTQRL